MDNHCHLVVETPRGSLKVQKGFSFRFSSICRRHTSNFELAFETKLTISPDA
jgi:hypothetical protein